MYMDDPSPYVFRVDPQFVHRPLATQAFGGREDAPLTQIADRVADAVADQQIPDLRVAAVTSGVGELEGQIVMVRHGFYFKRTGTGPETRIQFHGQVDVDEGRQLSVEGILDPERIETNSPHGNLSGRTNVTVVGIVLHADEDSPRVRLRPMLIGFPYYATDRYGDSQLSANRPEVPYVCVEEFGLDAEEMRRRVPSAEARRVFSMPEQAVKEAFAQILGVRDVPKDHGGERSDLIAPMTVSGSALQAAFAFKGPGGRPQPWTLHPANMGKRGDQGVRLMSEIADIYIVQHCAAIAANVRHLMEALVTHRGARYMIIDGDGTARILSRAGLLP